MPLQPIGNYRVGGVLSGALLLGAIATSSADSNPINSNNVNPDNNVIFRTEVTHLLSSTGHDIKTDFADTSDIIRTLVANLDLCGDPNAINAYMTFTGDDEPALVYSGNACPEEGESLRESFIAIGGKTFEGPDAEHIKAAANFARTR